MLKVGDRVTLPKDSIKLINNLSNIGININSYHKTKDLIIDYAGLDIIISAIYGERVKLTLQSKQHTMVGFSLKVIGPLFKLLNTVKTNITLERCSFQDTYQKP